MKLARCTSLFALVALVAVHAGQTPALGDEAHHRTLDEYRSELVQLEQLVATCKAAVGSKACAPDRVGPNEIVDFFGQHRTIDYAWLRSTLADAADLDSVAKKDRTNERKKINDSLDAAERRLEADATATTAMTGADSGSEAVARSRPALDKVLSTSEFQNVAAPSAFEQLVNRFFAWLNRKLSAVAGSGGMSPLLIRIIVYGSILICLTLLAWWYARQVRQQRLLHASSNSGPNPSAASAVDWQKRLGEAEALAAEGEWRGAVHYIYWAAISRLESAGNWPADRARTPREYLELLPSSHAKRPGLAKLTRSFERIWYGQRPAQEADYHSARSLLEGLTAR